MTERIIPAEDLTGLEITSVNGNLHLTGWNRPEIRVKEGAGDLQIKEKKGVLQISSPDNLFIHLPHSLPIQVRSVTGDASVRGLTSDLAIDSLAGDLSLRDISSTTIKNLKGDLFASRVQGDLRGETISGDALIDDVQGQVELKDLAGDLQIEKADGGIDVLAAGDGIAVFSPVPWQAYRIEVGGDLSVVIPADSDADLVIHCGGQEISLLPGKLDINSEEEDLTQKLGEGGTSLQLSAGGRVFVTDDEFGILTNLKYNLEELEALTVDFSSETAEHIKSSLDHLEDELQVSLAGLAESLEDIGLSEESLKDLGAKIAETSRKAAEKAEMAAIKAQAKVEKKIARARRKALQAREKTRQFDLNKFLETKASQDSVTEQERLLILKMLQEKKISPKEADNLLKALEGK